MTKQLILVKIQPLLFNAHRLPVSLLAASEGFASAGLNRQLGQPQGYLRILRENHHFLTRQNQDLQQKWMVQHIGVIFPV